MAVLLFAMTTAVMGCYQKDPDPIEAPSGTSKVEVTPIPTVNRQAEDIGFDYVEYYEWLENATEARDAYLEGKLSEKDALKAIREDFVNRDKT